MAVYHVSVTIENKHGINDPEGQTILDDLVIRSGATNVSKVRTAKMLRFTVRDSSKKSAKERIKKICDDLRIYNPLVSKVTLTVSTV